MCSVGTARGVRTAIYARVSSEQQVRTQTIARQVEALQQHLRQEGTDVDPELMFLDDGYSGATLVRPALERRRSEGSIDCTCIRRTDYPASRRTRCCYWRSCTPAGSRWCS